MRHYTVTEAAEALQLSVPTIKRYIYEGQLKSTKLPGGQHRIPASEIERLLGATPTTEADNREARLAVLERWVTELEAEVERLNATVQVLARYCAGQREAGLKTPGAPLPPTEILVLGPGCQRCQALYDLTRRLLDASGYQHLEVRHVRDLDAIAAFGPVLTPALVIDGHVVLSGRLPDEHTLRDLLLDHLTAAPPA